MNRKKIKIILPLAVVLVIAGVVIWALNLKKPFYYAGTIEATEITLSSQVMSVIGQFSAQEGRDVKLGESLVVMKGEDYKLNAALAQKDFERGQRLLNSGSITKADFDKLKFQRDRAALLVSWCRIEAPLDATVLQTYREPGELVAPGTTLLTLGDLSTVWAYIYVEEPMLVRLQLNQVVTGFLPELPGKTFKGRITVIRDQAEFTPKNVQTREERARLVYGIKVEFDNAQRLLKPGMSIEVKLPELP